MVPASGLIVDDHREARAWVRTALVSAFPSIEIATAADLASGLGAIDRTLPDVAVIDIGLPDGSGIDLIRTLHERDGRVFKIVSTVFEDDRHLFEALRAGAQGYVLKDESREQLSALFRGIVAGESPLSPSIARRILAHFHDTAQQRDEVQLTSREQEVLTLLAKGCTTVQAAELLELSANTVAGYVKSTYRKLNVSSRAEATMEAARRGLVSPASE
ncbi:MAG: response regulator transcription factor [Pseudomonadota bacterium]